MGQDQVSGRVSVLCWLATPVANDELIPELRKWSILLIRSDF